MFFGLLALLAVILKGQSVKENCTAAMLEGGMQMGCIQADATNPKAYSDLLSSDLAHALITDPPYCLLTRRRKQGDLRDSKNRKIDRGPVRRFESVKEYRNFTAQWMRPALNVLIHNAPLVVWTNLLGRAPIQSVAAELGWSIFVGEFIWGKRTRESNSGEEILRVVETALVFKFLDCFHYDFVA